MNNIARFSQCSNCGACYNICPQAAISVQETMFYQPMVDESKCIDCGLCQKVCPVNTPHPQQNLRSAYAGYHKNAKIVQNSSSGGAFFAIAEYVQKECHGVVYAATYTDACREVVFRSTDEVPFAALMKSKYVESKVEFSFREIKKKLLEGRMVLFSGAPCQVAGLKRYLGQEYSNLLTCDFSCGGMASHQLYQEYLEYIGGKLKSPVKSVDFRAKVYGWSRHSIKIIGENGKIYQNFAHNDPYFYSFVGSHINVREYCLRCDFANNHYADIVLADFWGYAKYSKIKNDDTGLSLLIANSEKGESLIEKIMPDFVMTALDLEKASYNMKERTSREGFLQKRAIFFERCSKEGFIKTMKQEKMQGKWKLMSRYIISKLKECLR